MRIRSSVLLLSLASAPIAALLTGCAGMTSTDTSPVSAASLKGNVHGGQQPIYGSHVYLMAVNTTAYLQPSVSTLTPNSVTFTDSVGTYVLTDSAGNFSITGDYTCTPGTQLYLYALGGNPGAGANSAAGLMAALGACPAGGSFATTIPYVFINEVSTVAAAYALAGFAVDATHISSSGTTLAKADVANAFLTPPNLVGLSTGVTLTTTPAGNGTVPTATINTLGNILAACINSTGPTSTSCTTLLGAAKSGGTTGTTPTDTATAAINIAHNPTANVSTLFGLVSASPQFSPTLASAPNDFILAVSYGGSGTTGAGLNGAYALAIDGEGDVWFTNVNNNSVSKLSPAGAPLSPATGFTGSALGNPQGIAIDLAENAWVVDAVNSNLVKFTSAGVLAATYTGGGLHTPQAISIDGTGNEWIVNNYSGASVSEFNSSGIALSPALTGFTGGGLNNPGSIAMDANGFAWVTNQNNSVTKLNNAGAPLSSSSGFTGGGLNNPIGVAIDNGNNAWEVNYSGNSISELNQNGTPVSPSAGFTGGGLSRPYGLAIDGGGNVWAVNYGVGTQSTSSVSLFSNFGTPLSPSTGLVPGTLTGPAFVAIDGSGNVWITSQNAAATANNAVTELIGAAIPVTTPKAYAARTNALGHRP